MQQYYKKGSWFSAPRFYFVRNFFVGWLRLQPGKLLNYFVINLIVPVGMFAVIFYGG
jgi:hypothetical protein